MVQTRGSLNHTLAGGNGKHLQEHTPTKTDRPGGVRVLLRVCACNRALAMQRMENPSGGGFGLPRNGGQRVETRAWGAILPATSGRAKMSKIKKPPKAGRVCNYSRRSRRGTRDSRRAQCSHVARLPVDASSRMHATSFLVETAPALGVSPGRLGQTHNSTALGCFHDAPKTASVRAPELPPPSRLVRGPAPADRRAKGKGSAGGMRSNDRHEKQPA